MFQSLLRSFLNHLYRCGNENVSVRHLSLICITSILTTIYSLKNCSVYGRSCRIYSPKSFGFFRINFFIFFLSLENAALGLRPRAVFSRPRSQFFTIRTSQPANNICIFFNLRFWLFFTSAFLGRDYFIVLHFLGNFPKFGVKFISMQLL